MPTAMIRFEIKGPSAYALAERVSEIALIFEMTPAGRGCPTVYTRVKYMNEHEATEVMHALLDAERQLSPDTRFVWLEIIDADIFRFFIKRT